MYVRGKEEKILTSLSSFLVLFVAVVPFVLAVAVAAYACVH